MKFSYKICLIMLLNFFPKVLLAQASDSLYVKAKVKTINYIDYYVVIKALRCSDKKPVTILSLRNDRSAQLSSYKDSCIVKTGKTYSFKLESTNRIQNGEKNYMFINLRRFYYGDFLLLEAGELPYLALNMYKSILYK